MYKFQTDKIVKRLSDGAFIPVDEGNIDYQQFKTDVAGIGVTCVEGYDVVTTSDYKDLRLAEYPSFGEQLDKIYHSGIDAWKADIKVIKDKYPKSQVGVTTTVIPHWVYDITN
tara:strand:- start:2373 stop:2711 length:339 start_codon:yes stop_codon:yes gene_type:complete